MRSRQRQLRGRRSVRAGRCSLAAPVAADAPAPAEAAASKRARTAGSSGQRAFKLDRVTTRSGKLLGTSKVILTVKPGQEANAEKEIKKLGGRLGRRLKLVDGMAVELPNRVIKQARRALGGSERPPRPSDRRRHEPRGVSVGARAVQAAVGLQRRRRRRRGHRLGHHRLARRPDLPAARLARCGWSNGQRVGEVRRLRQRPHDALRRQRPRHARRRHHRRQRLRHARRARRHRAGGAPGQPEGARRPRRRLISDVIAALDWAVANKAAYNIRVINLSVGAAVTESYTTDPLTLAAKRAVDAGIVVVAAAGNLGKNAARARRSTAASRRRATRPGCSRSAPPATKAR